MTTTLAACQRPAETTHEPNAAKPPTEASAPAPRQYAASDWPMPTPEGAAQSDLIVAPDGRVLLSWIEPQPGKGHALKFSSFANGRWDAAREIAQGSDWFVNWADTPHLAVTDDGALWAHWLQKSAAATYAYDVALVRSDDAGASWSRPVLVNDDGTPTEHGFVALWPAGRDRVGVAWLDGRLMAGADTGHDGHGAAPATQPAAMMTLRSAQFDSGLQRSGETVLDGSACDCCQTDVALTARGALLVYRDRTPAEIRDIYAIRGDGAKWAASTRIHADDWTMPACPVNGPSVATRDNDALVGWYTAADNVPMIKLARSTDAGDSFAAPLIIDRGEAVQGRIDVALDAANAWALWVREDAAGQSLQLVRFTPDLARELQRIEVAKLHGRGRATGFPQLALRDGDAYLVWTDVQGGKPRLHGMRIAAQ
ncbi:MAG: glycoside hydrolase [Gammaproteobacteria bacterium]|nr:glycoside hydrolase [Gammaproteobacteria bacterium]